MSASNQTVSTADYSAIVAVPAITTPVSTERLFDRNYKENGDSPIDQFLKNSNALNLLWINGDNISRELATVAFLGYMSAVESYVRSLVRGLILIDPHSLKVAEEKNITFGAALHHSKQLLPEALMDEYSFVHSGNIKETFKGLIGIDLSLDERVVKEFDKICQLRHCCVHRFGKLGAKNAMKLGLNTHNSLFEKPLILGKDELNLIAGNIRSVVKSINNAVYRSIMDRTFPIPKNKSERKEAVRRSIDTFWKKNYNDDKITYIKYYNLFATKADSIKSQKAKEMYDRFISEKNADLAELQREASNQRQEAQPANQKQ
ncbi:hypothetical protein GCM10027202_37290 [Microvirgula curvata]